MAEQWIKKYEPGKVSEIVGQEKAVSSLRDFVQNFSSQKRNAVLLYGPNGSGKTIAAYAVARESGLEILEVNTSDTRSADRIDSVIGGAVQQQSLFSKGKVILLDDIDALSGTKDRGGVQALVKLLEKSAFPVVITANDPWGSKFSSLRRKSVLIEFSPLSYLHIFRFLEKICRDNETPFDEGALKSLARMSGGDMRAAINDLQTLAERKGKIGREAVEELSERITIESMPHAMVKVMKTTDANIAAGAFDNVSEDIGKQMLWLDENIPKEYKKPADLAKAYDRLSKADVYLGRIRRWQHWRFLVYASALISAGVATSKDEKYRESVQYTPTTRILKLWKAKMKYMKRQSIAKKVAEHTHSSSRAVVQDTLPYLQAIFRKNRKMAAGIADDFDLDSEEIEWLGR